MLFGTKIPKKKNTEKAYLKDFLTFYPCEIIFFITLFVSSQGFPIMTDCFTVMDLSDPDSHTKQIISW